MKNNLGVILFSWILFSFCFSEAQTLSTSVAQLNFGSVYENAPDSLPLVIRNSIGKPVTVTGIRFYNTYGSPAFSVPYTWFAIADGDSTTIWVKFSPVHNIFHNTEMVIENDGLRGYISVDLVGQGKYSNHYYDATENLAEEDLKNAIHTATGAGYVSLTYNPARDSMFMWIDNKRTNGQGATQNTLECIYTGREAVGYTDRTDCQNNFAFNTEHTLPQSLFTSLEPMKSDLHHLFPTDNVANNERADNPFGVVTNPTWSNGGSKSDGTIFEPRDEQKGQSARALFYFVLRYQNYNSFLNSQEAILRTWHHTFPPTAVDKTRNNNIFSLQHNRNPFIDYPVLLDRITSVSTLSNAPVVNSIDLLEDTIIYGTIPTATPVVFDYVIVNNGNTNIQFTNFSLTHPSDLSFLNSGNDTVILPGESLTLHIRCITTVSDSLRAFLTFNTDATGNSFVSIPVFVNDLIYSGINELTGDLIISPNPAHDKFRIGGMHFSKTGKLMLYDMMGRCVLNTSLQNEGEFIDVSNFLKGVYLLQVSGSSHLLSSKLVIE